MLKIQTNQLTLTLDLSVAENRAAVPALLQVLPAQVQKQIRNSMSATLSTGSKDLLDLVKQATGPQELPAFHKVNFHQIDRQGRTVPGVNASIDIMAEGGVGGTNGYLRYLVNWRGDNFVTHLADINFYTTPPSGKISWGITNEALLAIVIDRLEAFQAGPFNCTENLAALTAIRDGLQALHNRTLNRAARQVEGTQQP